MRFANLLPWIAILTALVGVPASHFAQPTPEPQPGGKQQSEVRMPTPAFRTEVPDHSVDLILGRPTSHSMVLSILAYQEMDGYISYGTNQSGVFQKTTNLAFTRGVPVEVLLTPLQPNTRYYYQFCSRNKGTEQFTGSDFYSFTTARRPGSSFTFTVQADPHLDYGIDPDIYKTSLTNALNAKSDFHIDLGDTFMTDKYTEFKLAAPQYLAQRYYFGLIGHSAPLFLVLGNHDGEQPSKGAAGPNGMAVWSNIMRKRYFPNPIPDSFYTGNNKPDLHAGLLQNYYAWDWGDAKFIALDPFWYSARQRRDEQNNWGRTLGTEQYEWLKRTLEQNKARFTFVFLHHLVGGETPEGRGGSEASQFFEWGGKELNGEDRFAQKRPGWAAPIHNLLVKHGVSIVFHGHDHLYAMQERDGIIYQLVPQPGHSRVDNTRSALEYGYKSGVIQGASGILKVTVSPERAVIEYVRAYPARMENADRKSGSISHRYEVSPSGFQRTGESKP